MTDDQPQKPVPNFSFGGGGDHVRELPTQKGDLTEDELMSKIKPDATPREWKMCDVCHLSFKESNHVIEKSYADALKQRVAELGDWKASSEENHAKFCQARQQLAAAGKEHQNTIELLKDRNIEVSELKADIDDRMHRELNLRKDWLEARDELEKANVEIERLNKECISTFLHEQRMRDANMCINQMEQEKFNFAKEITEMLHKYQDREQKLVAVLELLSLEFVAGEDGIEYRCTCNRPLTECKPMHFSSGDRLYRVSYVYAEKFKAALAEHKGGG